MKTIEEMMEEFSIAYDEGRSVPYLESLTEEERNLLLERLCQEVEAELTMPSSDEDSFSIN